MTDTDKTLAERRAHAIADLRDHLERKRAVLATVKTGERILAWLDLDLAVQATSPDFGACAVVSPERATVLKPRQRYHRITNGHGNGAVPTDRREAIEHAIATTERLIAYLEQLANEEA
jgi:hypothetical protein